MKSKPIIALMVTALLSVSGCGDAGIGGGAYQATSVVVLPPDLDGAGGADTEVESGNGPGPTASDGIGNFSGRVVLTGAVPPLPLPPIHGRGADVKDAEFCAAEAVPNERLVVGSDNGVANVFIYLQRAPRGTPKPVVSEVPVDFDQKNCRFLPHCLVVPVGQTVRVLSDDGIAHNTHTYPKRGDQTNQGVSPKDREGQLRFAYRAAETEPLAVRCDLHGWMTAWHLPVAHPFVALTDADGNFEIKDLPAGNHVFRVWHEAAKGNFIQRSLKVTIRPGETTPQEIEYAASQLAL